MPSPQRANASHGYVDKQDVSLRDHIESRLAALEKSLDERFKSQEQAIAHALAANEKRLDGMNEFREALRDQSRQFSVKSDLDNLSAVTCKDIERLEEDIKSLNESRAEMRGKASQTQLVVAYIISIIGIIFGIINIVAK